MEPPAVTITDATEIILWRALRNDNSQEARLALIEKYLPLARSISKQMYRNNYPDGVEFEDYYHYAVTGLIESVDRYDFSLEASFKTFANYRMRGAILTGIEHYSEVRQQRGFRARQKERVSSMVNKTDAQGSASVAGGTTPGATEVSVPASMFSQLLNYTVEFAISYLLDDFFFQSQTQLRQNLPYESFAIRETQNRVNDIVAALPIKEQQVIRYHYYQGLAFEQIAQLMQISKGRVSQLHRMALQSIREVLQHQRDFDEFY